METNIKRYFGELFLFNHENICCVYSLESPRRGDSYEFTQHTIILLKKIRKGLHTVSSFAYD